MTDGLDDVVQFDVNDTVFGVDAQKSHRLIFCTLFVGVGIPKANVPLNNDSCNVQWHKLSYKHLHSFRDTAVKSLVPLLGGLSEWVSLARSGKVAHPASFSLNCFLKKFNFAKTSVLGKRDPNRGRKVQIKENRTLRRLQRRIYATTASLENISDPVARQRVLREVQLLEMRTPGF